MDEIEAMQQALTCARMVEGRTSPRPPVGAVIVRDGQIIGKGATSPPFGPHAEIQALTEAGAAASGADLYTTLEPCCITIHTPPCTDAIIAAGIRRVIVAANDPNPLVSGRGIERLRAAGIEVSTQSVYPEALELLRPFATLITQQRPFVTAKWAMTLDGKIATRTGDAYWISGPQARAWVHDLRDRVDAILVGAGTARMDNPQLTVRLPAPQRTPRPTPLRVVLATNGQLPAHLHLFEAAQADRTHLFVSQYPETLQYPKTGLKEWENLIQPLRPCSEEKDMMITSNTSSDFAPGIHITKVAPDTYGYPSLRAVLQTLAQQGYMHVLIEGGASILGSAFDQHCIDHVAAFISPKLIGGALAPAPIGRSGLSSMALAQCLENVHTQTLGQDILIEGDLTYNVS